MRNYRRFAAELKARTALEAIRGERMVSEIAVRHGIQLKRITNRKRQATDNLASVFDSEARARERFRQVAESIKTLGWTNPILIDNDGDVIAGHGRP